MAFLGCSRGLGRAVCFEMDRRKPLEKALLVARQEDSLLNLSKDLKAPSQIQRLDLAAPENVDVLLTQLKIIRPQRVFYFAGGGCYGSFASKMWKDHLWGLQVTFLTPARLLHSLLSDPALTCIEQIIFVGSQVADNQGDSGASSYAAAKHGLRGLIQSIVAEGCSRDLRLFRPGYMDTDMLPPNCPPRRQGRLLINPEEAACIFVDWALDPFGKAVLDL